MNSYLHATRFGDTDPDTLLRYTIDMDPKQVIIGNIFSIITSY